jgi:hypothetical protein
MNANAGLYPTIRETRHQALLNLDSASRSPLRIIFMRQGIPEVDEDPVPQVLRHVALKATDRLHTLRVVLTQQFSQLFGVDVLRQVGRLDQVAKHHAELAAISAAISPSSRVVGNG